MLVILCFSTVFTNTDLLRVCLTTDSARDCFAPIHRYMFILKGLFVKISARLAFIRSLVSLQNIHFFSLPYLFLTYLRIVLKRRTGTSLSAEVYVHSKILQCV
jgi:hypothetical protein